MRSLLALLLMLPSGCALGDNASARRAARSTEASGALTVAAQGALPAILADGDLPLTLLRHYLFLDDSSPDSAVSSCASDDGEDSPPSVMAAGRLRLLGRTSSRRTTDIEGSNAPVLFATYRIEVTSVARFTPHRELDIAMPSAHTVTAPFDGDVGVRIDTLELPVEDHGRDARQRWAICDPGVVTATDTIPGVWQFANHKGQWFQVIRWAPSGASWARVAQLADSVRKADAAVR